MIMKKDNSQNGFTLIEVMIAIALLTIGILGAATMQIAALGGNSNAIRVTQASTWAEDAIEKIMSWPYADPLLVDRIPANGIAGLNNTNVAGSPADGGPVVRGDFTIYWNVADNYPFTDCKTIRVIAQRSDKEVIKTVSLDFLKMRPI